MAIGLTPAAAATTIVAPATGEMPLARPAVNCIDEMSWVTFPPNPFATSVAIEPKLVSAPTPLPVRKETTAISPERTADIPVIPKPPAFAPSRSKVISPHSLMPVANTSAAIIKATIVENNDPMPLIIAIASWKTCFTFRTRISSTMTPITQLNKSAVTVFN